MSDTNVRVIGAGCGRTGTTSLKKALEILGFGPCYHMTEAIDHGHCALWEKYVGNPRDLRLLHSILGGQGYVSSCDFPTSLFWKEQLEHYPHAKVILTAREPEKWYKSCSDTIFKLQPGNPNTTFAMKVALILGLPAAGMGTMLEKLVTHHFLHDDWSKENVLATYKAHNDDVLRSCPKDKLLVFEVSQGWAPLCEFLHVPIPDVPFPHANETEEFKKNIRMMHIAGYSAMAVGAALVGFVGWRLSKLLYR